MSELEKILYKYAGATARVEVRGTGILFYNTATGDWDYFSIEQLLGKKEENDE